MSLQPSVKSTSLILTASILLGASSSQAALLAYEPFDYAAASNLQGLGGSELGFDGGSTWDIVNNGPLTTTATTNADVLAGGITFGDLQVAGNKGRYATSNAGTETKAIMRAIDFNVTSGTVWTSFLYQANASNDATGRGLGIYDSGGNRDFTSLGQRNVASGAGAVTYDSAAVNTAAGLTIATPYMIISRFENVGAASGGGTATMWMVNLTEFSAFDDDNFITVAELNTIAADRIAVANDTGSTPGISDDGTIGFVVADTTSSSRHAWWFDELRVGTTLNDVTPIPEPSVAILSLAGLALFCRRRI